MTTRILNEDTLHRTIIHECHQGNNYAIIQQEKQKDDWITENHIMIPKYMISFMAELQLKQLRKESLRTVDGDTSIENQQVVDEKELPEDLRKLLFRYDSECIPFYENQEGVWQEMEMLESFWGIETIKSPEI